MKKHPTAWLLTLLVAFGAGQAVPASVVKGSAEGSAIVQLLKARREKRVRRERTPQRYARNDSATIFSSDFPRIIRNFCNDRLLRAPPLSSRA